MKSKHLYKRHNKNLLLYHAVCPIKYRRQVITGPIATTLKEVCQEISERHEIHFVEIGTDEDHVHFLIQSVPMLSAQRVVQIVKSITARELFLRHPEVKKQLWGGKFWTNGYYVNTVGQYGNEDMISNYVRGQDKEYQQIHRSQLTLFEGLA